MCVVRERKGEGAKTLSRGRVGCERKKERIVSEAGEPSSSTFRARGERVPMGAGGGCGRRSLRGVHPAPHIHDHRTRYTRLPHFRVYIYVYICIWHYDYLERRAPTTFAKCLSALCGRQPYKTGLDTVFYDIISDEKNRECSDCASINDTFWTILFEKKCHI